MRTRNQPGSDDLERWIADLREASPEDRLSASARARVLSRNSQPARAHRYPRLFVPAFRLAAGFLVPVVLAGTIGLLALRPSADRVAPARLEARKVGDHVVFTIANGKSRHRVYKSTDPRSFDRSRGIAVEDGRFADRAHNGADLVFYLVD